MAEVDTSIYKDNVAQNPLEVAGQVLSYKNKLLENTQKQQQIQQGNIGIDNAQVDLAMKRFGILNSAISGIMGDDGFGKTDVKPRINEVVSRLVRDKVISPEHAIEALKGIPDQPTQQANAVRNLYSQTQDAVQRAQSFFGSPQTQSVGGALLQTQTPQYPNKPVATRSAIPLTLSPDTQSVDTTPGSPTYGAKGPIGQPGVPQVQQGGTMPATPLAPARPMVPSTPKVMGDKEAIQSGVYDAPATVTQRIDAAKPAKIVSALPAGAEDAMKGSASAYNDAMVAGGRYAQRVNPLRQAIPILEKMKTTDTGPITDRMNDLKSAAQSLGAGTLLGIDPEKIKDFNELKKYFNQYSAQAAATLGPKTNEGLATAVTSNPNVHMDKLSATELSKVALGVERMQQAGAHEFDQMVQSGKAQPGDFNRFMLKWGTEQDPRAFVYDLMDAKAQDKVKKLAPAERAKVAEGMKIAEKWKLLGDVHRE